MTTWNGDDENLIFSCNSCGGTAKIEIDLHNPQHQISLWHWLQQHSANGGKYENVPIEKDLQLKVIKEELYIIDHGKKRKIISATKEMLKEILNEK